MPSWNVGRDQQGMAGEAARFVAPSRSLRHSQGTQVETLALSPDGQTLAVDTGEREIHLWDLRRDDSRKIVLPPAKQSPVRKLEFSPDGRYLAAGRGSLREGPDELLLWDLKAAEDKSVLLPLEKTAAAEPYYTSVDALKARRRDCVASSCLPT